MDKNTIVTGLIHALENGQGELEDLEKLLQRAQKDIVTAKEEEEKRKEAADLRDKEYHEKRMEAYK